MSYDKRWRQSTVHVVQVSFAGFVIVFLDCNECKPRMYIRVAVIIATKKTGK